MVKVNKIGCFAKISPKAPLLVASQLLKILFVFFKVSPYFALDNNLRLSQNKVSFLNVFYGAF